MAEEQPREADPAVEALADGFGNVAVDVPAPVAVDVPAPVAVDVPAPVAVDVPAEFRGRIGAKKGAKKGGRRPGTPNEIRMGETYYVLIDKNAGTAKVYTEEKQGRTAVVRWGFKSKPKDPEPWLVVYEDASMSLFWKFDNIDKISTAHEKSIKTVYKGFWN